MKLKNIPSDIGLIIRLTTFFFIAQIPLQLMQFNNLFKSVLFSDNFKLYPIIIVQILLFIIGYIGIYVLFACYCIWIARYSKNLANKFRISSNLWAIVVWLLSTSLLVTYHQYLFPYSDFSISSININNIYLIIMLFFLLTVQITLFGISLYHVIQAINIKYTLSFLILSLGYFAISNFMILSPSQQTNKPNIILLGIDCLRADFVSSINPNATPTPNIDHFIDNSVVFENAYTPLARTFPAWTSILTGNYPKHTNARFNLTEITQDSLYHTLPRALKKLGYTAFYAIDETRFSNIDKEFGFDYEVHPAIGLNSFLLIAATDNILLNLISTTRLGAYLLPFHYMNRSYSKTYYPQTFTNAIAHKLKFIKKRPLFIAIHLELPHTPRSYAKYKNESNQNYFKNENQKSSYQMMVSLADQQIGEIRNLLKKNHLLDNSIIILLSDHGEGLGLQSDRITNKVNFIKGPTIKKPQQRLMLSALAQGHGTDILTPIQYQSLLAMHFPDSKPHTISENASLIDIMPTLLDYFQVNHKKMDGISLLPFIKGNHLKLNRSIFIETGLTSQLFTLSHPNTHSIGTISDIIKLYTVKPNGKLTISRKKMSKLVKSKQHGIINDNWLLANYPNKNNPADFILVNLTSKQWTLDLESKFAKKANANVMKKQLLDFYQDEIIDQAQHMVQILR